MMCPECGGPMAALDIQCAGCGYTLPGAESTEPAHAGVPAAAVEEVAPPPAGVLKYRLPEQGADKADRSAMHPTVRREGPASTHSTRPKTSIGIKRSVERMSAEGGTNPPPPKGIGVARPNPGDALKVLREPAPNAPEPLPHQPRPHQPRPAEGGHAPVAPARRHTAAPPKQRTQPAVNTLSSIALLLAILGTGPVAIVVAIVALTQIHKSTGIVGGQGRATIAIVWGGVQTVAAMIVLALILGAGSEMTAGFRVGFSAGMLETVATAQQDVRTALFVDEDGDGRGEFTTVERMSQLSPEYDLTELTGEKMVALLHYRLRVELPATTNQRERQWWAFMEPTDAALPWLYVDETGIMRFAQGIVDAPRRRDAKDWPATNSETIGEQLAQSL